MELNINLITVGKYKDKYLQDMLKDRNYCKWIIQQDWFKESYEYLYNKVKEYDPKVYFYNEREIINFIDDYKYFNFTLLLIFLFLLTYCIQFLTNFCLTKNLYFIFRNTK